MSDIYHNNVQMITIFSTKMENIVKWPVDENMCMLHVMYNGLDEKGRELMTCGGTLEPRELLKSVMVNGAGRTLLYGASSEDAHKLLEKIVQKNQERGKTVMYTWKKVGYNRKSDKRWNVRHIWKTCLAKKGMHVIFGKSKKNSMAHEVLIRKLKKLEKAGDKDEIENLYAATAKGWSALDHAVGIKVDHELNATLICNGTRDGAKIFSMVNLADRMEDVCICYEYDLVEV